MGEKKQKELDDKHGHYTFHSDDCIEDDNDCRAARAAWPWLSPAIGKAVRYFRDLGQVIGSPAFRKSAKRLATRREQSSIREKEISVMIVATFLIFVLPLALSQATAPPNGPGNDKPAGVIQGMVQDAQEQPVPGARVKVLEIGRVMKAAPILSDQEGKFEIRNLRPGRYMVFASKEDANYPDTESRFYADASEEVTISKERPLADVIVKLPPAAAVLIGSVTDTKSKQPVPGAQIRISQADDPTRWIQFAASLKTADFRMLVPSNRRIRIECWAPGYRASMIELEGLPPNLEHTTKLELIPQ